MIDINGRKCIIQMINSLGIWDFDLIDEYELSIGWG